jgi:hypothetical protein
MGAPIRLIGQTRASQFCELQDSEVTMNNTNQQNAGNSNKLSFQSRSLGHNKPAAATKPATAAPEAKVDVKPEVAKPVENKPVLEKQS